MREHRQTIDTDAMPWEPLSDVLSRKVLNGDPDAGPHTLLLRSGPRDPGPAFAQYHPIDEELFCLDGDFTFDGSTWFGAGSYAYYPAYFVHGSRVHVRGGYLVYLRLSGFSELFTVDEPESDTPYYVGEGETADYALQLADTMADPGHGEADANAPFKLMPLHRNAASGKGSTLLATTEVAAGQRIELQTGGLLELFTLSGAFSLDSGGHLAAHTYHCETGERPGLILTCKDAGRLLISHDSDLQVR